MSQFTIRWVLTHDPIALFEEAARRFADLVREQSDGQMEVQVSTPAEYGNGTRVPPAEVMARVAAGQLEMSQTYSTVLGKLHHRLWALDLPFLFESHEHAARVLDGPVGQELLAGLVPSGLRGLAFTYSGGYRILSTTERQIHRLEDLRGLRVRTSFNPVVKALFETLGARPHAAQLQAIPALTRDGVVDAAESTWPRYWDMGHHRAQTIVNETGHSLFLTALVVNEAFYQRLPARLRDVLHSVSLRVAAIERDKSVRDGEAARRAHQAQGGTVVTLSAAETMRLRRISSSIYDRFVPEFGRDLIDRIKQGRLGAASAVA